MAGLIPNENSLPGEGRDYILKAIKRFYGHVCHTYNSVRNIRKYNSNLTILIN